GALVDGDDILLVVVGAGSTHGVLELALAVGHVADDAANRRAVHVHVKDTEKDADTGARTAIHLDGNDVGYATVAGRDDGTSDVGDFPIGIAKEPGTERAEGERDQRPCRSSQPGKQPAGDQRSERVI